MLKTPAIASPTSAISSVPNGLPLSTQATGTSTAQFGSPSSVQTTKPASSPSSSVFGSSPRNDYAATFQSFVNFFEGPAVVQHSFLASATSSSVSSSSPSMNDYVDMFQPFVEFFEGPVANQRFSSTMATSAVLTNGVVPLSSVSSVGAMDDHMAAETSINPSQNTNAPLIMCVITVITMVLVIWPALCANRRVAHTSPNNE